MYSRILVPIDGSRTSERGFIEALALAERLGAHLDVLHVVDARLLMSEMSGMATPQQLLEDWRASGDKLVAEAIERGRARGVDTAGAVRVDAALRVCDLIVEEARSSGAQLIVMGTHGRRGLRRLALGSDAELVLRESPVPVLLVRGSEEDAS
jgi:nucleotide-binding universal stress UspA family protein